MMFYVNPPLSPMATPEEQRIYELMLSQQAAQINKGTFILMGALCLMCFTPLCLAIWQSLPNQ